MDFNEKTTFPGTENDVLHGVEENQKSDLEIKGPSRPSIF